MSIPLYTLTTLCCSVHLLLVHRCCLRRDRTPVLERGDREGVALKVHKCYYTSEISSTGKFTSPCTCRDPQSDNTSDIISPVKHLTSVIPLAHASSGLINRLCSPQSASTPPSFSSDDRFTLSCEDVDNINRQKNKLNTLIPSI